MSTKRREMWLVQFISASVFFNPHFYLWMVLYHVLPASIGDDLPYPIHFGNSFPHCESLWNFLI